MHQCTVWVCSTSKKPGISPALFCGANPSASDKTIKARCVKVNHKLALLLMQMRDGNCSRPPPWRPLLVAGLLAIITVAGSAWDGAGPHAAGPHAASPHAASRDSHVVRKAADKRVVHGPNYHPPYSAIVIDDNS